MSARRRRLADILRGLTSLALLAAVIVGVPFLLLTFGATLLPPRGLTWDQIGGALMRPDDGTLLIAALQLLVWLLWAAFTLLVAAEVLAQLRGRAAPTVRGLGFLQRPAAALVTAVAVLLTINTESLHAVAAPIVATAPEQPNRPVAHNAPTAPSPAAAVKAEPELPRYTVRRYDSLWRIADRHLGDGLRWREIHALNVHQLPNPDHIHPGMVLRLPADATGLDHTSLRQVPVQAGDTLSAIANRELGDAAAWPPLFEANRGRVQPDGTLFNDPDRLQPGFALLIPSIPTRQPPPPPSAVPVQPSKPPTPSPASPPTQRPAPTTTMAPLTTAQSEPSSQHDTERPGATLPSGAIVGLTLASAISAAITLLWLRRRHRYQPRPLSTAGTPKQLPAAARALRRADQHPDRPTVTVGATDVPIAFDHQENELPIDPIAQRGLGLIGPGAHAAARAILISYLAESRTRELEVVLPQHDLERLIGSVQASTPTNLRITDTLDSALTHLETEHIRRARLLDSTATADMLALRQAAPDEDVPRLILIATPDPRSLHRMGAIQQLGSERDIGGVVLGRSDTGPTYEVDDDGSARLISNPGNSDAPKHVRFFTAAAREAADLLAVLAEAHGVSADAGETETRAQEENEIQTPDPASVPTVNADRPVTLTLFGPPAITVQGDELATGLRSNARELLLYLALRPSGTTLDQALETLWPDTEMSRAREAFHTAVGNIRKVLRTATDLPDEKFVLFNNNRYRLDPTTVDADTWRFEHALRQAQVAEDTAQQADALTTATTLYTGQLAADLGLEWLDLDRANLHRRALDAHSALADLYEGAEPDRALAVLEQAIRRDPYAEALYARIMRIQVTLGRHDAAQRTYRLLQAHLAEIDAEPDIETQKVLQSGASSLRA